MTTIDTTGGFVRLPSPTKLGPCVKCGASDRYEKNGDCKPCARARSLAAYAANPIKTKEVNKRSVQKRIEKVKADRRAYYIANAEKIRIAGAARYLKNIDARKAKAAEYRALNVEKIKAANRDYCAKNSDKKTAKAKAWGAANPELKKIHSHNTRAKRKGAKGSLSKGLLEKLFKLQRGLCACCKQPLGSDFHMDHIMPIALGGKNNDGNMQLLRQRCNNQKSAKHPVDFMQSRGFLL